MYNNCMDKRKKLIDITGQKFGRLTVESYLGNRRWLCLCECGNQKDVHKNNLAYGSVKSCGCLRREGNATKHGFHGTKAYNSWCSIKKRCTNQNDPLYSSYGGNGISLCDDWLNDPKAFCEYVGAAPSNKHLIDRIDNRKGYEPGNVRWVDNFEQANNKTNNVKIEFQGQKFSSISDFIRWLAPQLNVNKASLQRELQKVIY